MRTLLLSFTQIIYHPYVVEEQDRLVKYGLEHGIVSEAYSPLMYVSFLHILGDTFIAS